MTKYEAWRVARNYGTYWTRLLFKSKPRRFQIVDVQGRLVVDGDSWDEALKNLRALRNA